MGNKYDEAYSTIVFKIACLMFREPVTECQINLVDGWARQAHIHETIHNLDSTRQKVSVTPEEATNEN